MILILLLAVLQRSIISYLITNPDYYQLEPYSWGSDDFRATSLGDAVTGLNNLDPDIVITLIMEHDYDLMDIKDTRCNNRLLTATRPADYRKLEYAHGTILGDLEYFPIPKSRNENTPEVAFENGWMDGRGYVSGGENSGGDNSGESGNRKNNSKRCHEGCDIIGSRVPPRYYLVISMTDGIVEKIG